MPSTRPQLQLELKEMNNILQQAQEALISSPKQDRHGLKQQVFEIESTLEQMREAHEAATAFSNLPLEEQNEALQVENRMLRAAYGLRLAGAWVDGIMRGRMGSALHTMHVECRKINQTKQSLEMFNTQLATLRQKSAVDMKKAVAAAEAQQTALDEAEQSKREAAVADAEKEKLESALSFEASLQQLQKKLRTMEVTLEEAAKSKNEACVASRVETEEARTKVSQLNQRLEKARKHTQQASLRQLRCCILRTQKSALAAVLTRFRMHKQQACNDAEMARRDSETAASAREAGLLLAQTINHTNTIGEMQAAEYERIRLIQGLRNFQLHWSQVQHRRKLAEAERVSEELLRARREMQAMRQELGQYGLAVGIMTGKLPV